MAVGRVPVDTGAPCDVQQSPGIKVDKDQSDAGVFDQISNGVEEIVARIIGYAQMRGVRDVDETGRAAAVRSVIPVRGMIRSVLVSGANKQRVCARYMRDLRVIQVICAGYPRCDTRGRKWLSEK